MRRIKLFSMATLLILLAGVFVGPAEADGIIIPDPPFCDLGPCPEPFPISQLAIEYHRVDVTIEDQVAVTHVDQVFRNDNDWTLEGTYVFPLPKGALVSEFTLWIDGEPVEGEVLTREEARKIYEDIVRNLRDPALLEYIDQGAVQASIFPIAPGEERRIELEYTQVLQADSGLIHYRYPLNTEKFSTQPLEDVRISVHVRSPQPVRAIYSPSHRIDIDRDSDYRFSVGYEDNDVKPDMDFDLYYSIADEDIGLNLLTFRDPQGDDTDGFFLLLAAPSVEVDPDRTIPKDVLIVLDRSGSMDGEKFQQAQEALHYVLDHLNAEDHFNIIAFSTGTRSYASRLRSSEEVAEAKRWVDSLSAAGSTDINLALLEALAQVDRGRSTIVIFLTDGLPTEGVTETVDILENVQKSAPDNVRLFAFGVGYDVDTFLLDSLANDHHGATTYVSPGQAIDEAVSGFYAKVSTPVLTDLELDFGDVVTYDLYPDPLPDLFAGSQLILVGRYKRSGSGSIILTGRVEGRRQTFEYEDHTFRKSGGPDFLPRLWATRKIGALLNQVRLHGPEEELVDQIVRLSIRYGIVTPYTSYLVTEPTALGVEAQDDIVNFAFEKMMNEPMAVTGADAVERAAAEGEFREATVPLAPQGSAQDVVRIAGSRTYRLINGVWIDTTFDPDTMSTTRVSFLSDDYFALADARADLRAAFALGPNVIAMADGVAYEIIDAEFEGDPIEIPESLPEDTEEGSTIDVPSPSVREPKERGRELTLPCPGFVFTIGLVFVPWLQRKHDGTERG
ncbi:MAG: VWA domain-containing protein [Anaerolineales bacterium]|nr:VWA domain-containing protein [Anaerolineales bacterium]